MASGLKRPLLMNQIRLEDFQNLYSLHFRIPIIANIRCLLLIESSPHTQVENSPSSIGNPVGEIFSFSQGFLNNPSCKKCVQNRTDCFVVGRQNRVGLVMKGSGEIIGEIGSTSRIGGLIMFPRT